MAIRGRVLARDGTSSRVTDDARSRDVITLLVRTDTGEVRTDIPASAEAHLEGGVRPGDWVEIRVSDESDTRATTVRVVIRYTGGAFPEPSTETARMPERRRSALRARAQAMAALRQFFAERDFLEVDTPVIVPAPGLEIHLEAVPAAGDRFLITSPEFQMKRLLCAGLQRIYTVCKSFRAHEEGHQHSTEFTMLEWYRAFAGLDDILRDTEELVAAVARAVTGGTRLQVAAPDEGPAGRVPGRIPGRIIDVAPPWIRMTVAEAMLEFAELRVTGDEDAATLAARARAAGIEIGAATAWDDIFYCAFVARVEPALASFERPVAILDWPAPLSALARRKPDDPRVVERFEAYLAGVELCNAYGELTDPSEQRSRFAADLAARRARGLTEYPLDTKFARALDEGLPPCAGIALGIDRLVMSVTGSRHIRDVLTFGRDEL